MNLPAMRWITLLGTCLVTACYSTPEDGDGTEVGTSGGTATAGDGAGDDGGPASTTMTSAASSPGGDGSTFAPDTTGPGAETTGGLDDSTGAAVGTTSGGSSGDGSSDGAETTAGAETASEGSSSDDATTGPVVPAGQCNEMLGVGCEATEFCNYPDDMCGAGQHGTCEEQPAICNLIFQPSCGCNGMNYSNPCVASGNGTDLAHLGDC